jgi:polyketide cyclase/dehydrase/lipid transport protein
MNKTLALGLAIVLALPFTAFADKQLIAQQSIEIKGSPQAVWDLVKNFDALAKWHPAFQSDVIKSGKNNTKGAMRTLTLSSGESFDEQLLKFDDARMFFRYRIVGDSPLPITHYVSTLSVKKSKGAMTKVIWQGKFDNKPDSGKSDDEVVDMINGVYKTGLEHLKEQIESGRI